MKYRHITRFGIFFVASMATLVACTDDNKGINDNTPEDRCTESSCGSDKICNTDTGKCEDKSAQSQEQPCQSNADCKGQICEGGKCVNLPDDACLSDDDCYHQYCVQNKCVECKADEHCDEGGVCENNACKYECTSNDDCHDGFICEAHHCVEFWCDDDLNCPDGQVCKPDHHCGLECTNSTECSDNKICSAENRCVYECEDDTNCSGGKVCRDHRCALECNEDAECGDLKICDKNICRYECENDTECSGNAQCKQYRCKLECDDDNPCTSDIMPFCSDQNHCVACRNDDDCAGDEMACDTTEHLCKNRCDLLTCDEQTEVCNRDIGRCEVISCRQLACGDEDCILDEDQKPHCTAVDTCDFANDSDCDGIHDDVDPCPYNPHVNSVEEGQIAECNIFTYDEVTVFEIWHASDLNRLKTLGASGIGPNVCITDNNDKPCSEIRLMRNINLGDVSTVEDAPLAQEVMRISSYEIAPADADCYMTYSVLPKMEGLDKENLFVFDGRGHRIEAYKDDGTRCAMKNYLFEQLRNVDIHDLALNYSLNTTKTFLAGEIHDSHITNIHVSGNIVISRNTSFSIFASYSYRNVYDNISFTGSFYSKGYYGLMLWFSEDDEINHLTLDVDTFAAMESGGLVANTMNSRDNNSGNHSGHITAPKIHIGTLYSNKSVSVIASTIWFEHIVGANNDAEYDIIIDQIPFADAFYGITETAFGSDTIDGLRVKIGKLFGNRCFLVCDTSWGGAWFHDAVIDVGTINTPQYNGLIHPYAAGYDWTKFERITLRIDELISSSPSIFSDSTTYQTPSDINIEIGNLTVNSGDKSIFGFSRGLKDGKNLHIHIKGNILLTGDNNRFYGMSSEVGNIENSSFKVDGDFIVEGSNTTIYGLTGNLTSNIKNSQMSYGNIVFNGENGKLYSLVANANDGSSLSDIDYSIKTIRSAYPNTEVNLLAGNLVGTMVDNIRMRIEDDIAVNGNVYIVGQYEKSHLTNAAFELNSVSVGANQFVPFKQVKGDDNIFENIAIYTNVNTSNTYTSGFMGDLMTDQISLKNLSLASRFHDGDNYLDIPAVLHNADTLLNEDGKLDFSGKNGLPYMESVFYNVPAGVSGRACPDSLDCSNASSSGLFFIEYDNKLGAVKLILDKYLPTWINAEFESNGEKIYMPWPKSKTEGENEGGENGETPKP